MKPIRPRHMLAVFGVTSALLLAGTAPAQAETYAKFTTWQGNYRCALVLTTYWNFWERLASGFSLPASSTRTVSTIRCPRPPIGNERFGWWSPPL